MTDVEATVQRYYGDRPVIQRIDDALRAAGVDPERPSHRDLWPFDQLHSRGIVATREHADRAGIQPDMYVLDLGCGLGGASRYLAAECGCRVAAIGGGKAVISSNVKVAAAGASLDVPLGHKDDSWSFPHFDTITVSVADAPRPNEILVVVAIADGGRLQNRCGSEPIR